MLPILTLFQIDLTNFTLSSNLVGGSSQNVTALDGALKAAKQALNMTDYYTIYLRGYCSWNGNDEYANCSEPTTTSAFFFDPITVWGLNNTGYNTSQILPASFLDGLAAYKKGSQAMYYLFAIALAFDAATVLVGITAIFSRWGSLFTTIFADLASLVTVASAIAATVIFPIVSAAMNKELKDDYGIKTNVNSRGLILGWAAAALAIGAGFFWSLSVCCCSGRSPYKGYREDRRTRAEKTPYTYERVGSPYMGPRNDQSVPLNTFNINMNAPSPNLAPQTHSGYNSGPSGLRDNTAYEPFRSHA